MPDAPPSFDALFARLAKSPFRRRFRLGPRDRAYLLEKGTDTIRRHAEDFVRTRLAPAHPPNDGKQTPMRGHPVFVAQHATACCCRTCLRKWHSIPEGLPLDSSQQHHIVDCLLSWLSLQLSSAPPSSPPPTQPTLPGF